MNDLSPALSSVEIGKISTLGLAYVGDGVYELLVRTWLVTHHHTASLDLHRSAVAYVNASAQAGAYEMVAPLLDEEELAVFKRGRNAKVNQIPPHATSAQYHAATGLETLFGWLYVAGRQERISFLFDAIMSGCEADRNNPSCVPHEGTG